MVDRSGSWIPFDISSSRILTTVAIGDSIVSAISGRVRTPRCNNRAIEFLSLESGDYNLVLSSASSFVCFKLVGSVWLNRGCLC